MSKRSVELVESKLIEANFFLEKLANSKNFDAAQFYFSAFVSAARTVTFAIQAVMKSVNGFAEWYGREQDSLKADPIARYFHNVRTVSQHLGVNPVTVGFMLGDNHKNLYFFLWDGKDDRPKGAPSEDVVSACTKYVLRLTILVWDCYQQFSSILDPDGNFTPKKLISIKRKIKKEEKTLDQMEISDDEIWVYRKYIAGTAIGWVFAKFINEKELLA